MMTYFSMFIQVSPALAVSAEINHPYDLKTTNCVVCMRECVVEPATNPYRSTRIVDKAILPLAM